MATKIGELFIDVKANIASFVSDLDTAQVKSTAVGAAIGTVFGNLATNVTSQLVGMAESIPRGFVDAIKGTVEFGENLSLLSEKLGISVDKLSSFNYAAKLTGTSAQDLETGIGRFAKQIGLIEQGAAGSEKALLGLAQAGVTTADFTLPLEQLFQKFAAGLAILPDGEAKIAAGSELMGRGFEALIPTVNEIGKGMDVIAKGSRDAGFAMSQETAEASRKLAESGKDLDTQWTGFKLSIGSEFLDTIAHAIEGINRLTTAARGLAGTGYGIGGQSVTQSPYGMMGGFAMGIAGRLGLMEEDIPGPPAPYAPKISPPGFAYTKRETTKAKADDGMFQGPALKLYNADLEETLAVFNKLVTQIDKQNWAQAMDDNLVALTGHSRAFLGLMETVPDAVTKAFTTGNMSLAEMGTAFAKFTPTKEGPWAGMISNDAKIALEDFRIGQESISKSIQKSTSNMADFHKELTHAMNSLNDGLANSIVNGGNLRNVFLGITKQLEEWAIKEMILIPIEKTLSGIMGGGGFFSSIIGGIAGLFGGGKKTPSFSFSGFDTPFGDLGTNIPGFASGGPVIPDMPIMVGERGPEIFMPSAAGTVLPNSALGGRGAPQIVQHIAIDARGSQPGVELLIYEAMRQAHQMAVKDAVAAVQEGNYRRA